MTLQIADDADRRIRVFARVLSAAWTEIRDLRDHVTGEPILNDWMQATWEQVVESWLPFRCYLVVYDGGAESYDDSSRVYKPDVLPTHIVVCSPAGGRRTAVDELTGNDVTFPDNDFPVEELVALEDEWYAAKPPFDHVRVGDHVTQHVLASRNLVFRIRAVTPEEV